MWEENTYPFTNFNGAVVEAETWEWISNFIPHFIGYVIIYPSWAITLVQIVYIDRIIHVIEASP